MSNHVILHVSTRFYTFFVEDQQITTLKKEKKCKKAGFCINSIVLLYSYQYYDKRFEFQTLYFLHCRSPVRPDS